MTPPLKPLPSEAFQYSSVNFFRDQAQTRLNKISTILGKDTPTLRPEDIRVENQVPGDGKFSLIYENPDLDIVIRGLVYTGPQEMHLTYYRKSQPSVKSNFDYLEMKDGCTLTQAAVGKNELNSPCQDGIVSPRLLQLKNQYQSLTAFDQFCTRAYGKYLREHPDLPQKGGYDLKRTQIFNPEPGNYAFALLYENPANGFYCRGNISTKGFQKMFLTSGSRKEWEPYNGAHLEAEELLTKAPTVHEMDDACRLTRDLVGEKEYHGECKEFSSGERKGISAVNTVWKGIEVGFMVTGAYELASGGVWAYDKIFKTAYHAESFAKWGSPTRALLRGGRWLGSRTLSGGRALLSRSWALAGRLRNVPSLLRGARLAYAGSSAGSTTATTAVAEGGLASGGAVLETTGAAAGGGASAGLGAQLGVGLVGFAIGFGAGIGLEKLQQGIFGNSLSGLAGDAAFWALGPADADTIEWWDKWMGWLP